MLIDANILIYAVDRLAPAHVPARRWLEEALGGDRRVGIPWQSYWAFIRIATNPRALENPLTPAEAWEHVAAWRASSVAWEPHPGAGHAAILARLLVEYDVRGGLVSDAILAALCVEHGLTIVSNDSDFARFTEVQRLNPLR